MNSKLKTGTIKDGRLRSVVPNLEQIRFQQINNKAENAKKQAIVNYEDSKLDTNGVTFV